MKTAAMTMLAASICSIAHAAELPRSTPEQQGISSTAIHSFITRADRELDSLHSIMLVRHGNVVAEGWWAPYNRESRHALFSLSKSFTSTGIGLAIAEGKLSLDDEVLKFFPEDAPAEPTQHLRSMRVSDLLRMSTGHDSEPRRLADEPWTKTFLHHPVSFKPGTHFLYNTSATYMLSAILQKATGETLLDYLQPRLFQPLGIENPTWETSPQGITVGGYGLSIRTEDIARFGQLYLQRGEWNGKQLVPAEWIAAATSLQTSNGSSPLSDWDQGYGYQFWRCRHGVYRGDGAFGQYCVVFPEQDAVIAITAGLGDMQAVLNLIWDELLPAMESSPLAADAAGHEKLTSTLANLSLPPVSGTEEGADIWGAKYVFADERRFETLTFDRGEEGAVTIQAQIRGEQYRLPCGRGEWKRGEFSWGLLPKQPVAATGAWTAADTFTAKLCFYETPHVITMTFKTDANELRVNAKWNVAFWPTNERELVGKRELRK